MKTANKSVTTNNETEPKLFSLRLYDDFLAKTSIDRLQKILARYELYKMAMAVPGNIVECGVMRGSGIYTWAKLQRIFKPNNEQKIIGFDFFEKNRNIKLRYARDKQVLAAHSAWLGRETILENLSGMDVNNVELIAGDVAKTTKEFARQNLGFRISLLYLDVDVYDGTLACLKNLYSLVSPGGVVAFDEYGYRGFGESNAVDEYFQKQKIRLSSIPWANTPTAYFIKEGF